MDAGTCILIGTTTRLAGIAEGTIFQMPMRVKEHRGGANLKGELTMKQHDMTEQAYKNGYEKGKADAQQWIPVTERLPDNKEHDWVLAQVVEDNGYMHIPTVMEYRQNINDWFEETYGWLSSHNGMFAVTHWMPLPSPPSTEGSV